MQNSIYNLNKKFDDIIKDFVYNALTKLFVSRIGVIEKVYEASAGKGLLCNVTLVDKFFEIENGSLEEVEYPMLIDVPIIQHWNSQGGLQCPIVDGDECLLICLDVDIKNWLLYGGVQPPKTNLTHSLDSCVAIVGLSNSNKTNNSYQTTQTRLFYNETQIVLDTLVQISNSQTNIHALLTDIKSGLEAVKSLTILDGTGAPCTITDSTALDNSINDINTKINQLFKS
jgi:hypothetical protein